MKCESATRQPKYLVEPLDGNECRVTLYANETPVEREDGTHYEYDRYSMITQNRPGLGQYISGHLDAWIAAYEEAEVEEVAAAARRARDKLLAETDAEMVMDRMQLAIPEKITTANLLSTVKAVFDAIAAATSGVWAKYRQELRDVPQQPGFPYDIEWPAKPDKGD